MDARDIKFMPVMEIQEIMNAKYLNDHGVPKVLIVGIDDNHTFLYKDGEFLDKAVALDYCHDVENGPAVLKYR